MVKLCCTYLHSFGHVARRYDLPGAACLVSGADRCSVSSVRACVPVRGVVCLASGTACPAACRVRSFRVRWAGVSTSGAYGASRGWGWSIVSVEKIQKRRFLHITPSFLRKSPRPLLPISKIFRKNKKTPTKGLCSVLYLPYKP